MKILGTDFIPDSIITNADTINDTPGHPVENVQDSRLSHNARILPAGYSGNMYMASLYNQNYNLDFKESEAVMIDFDLGAQKAFNTFCLAGNNFNNIDYRISWAVDDISTPDGSFNYLYSGEEWVSYIELSTGIINARYVRFEITDAQQADTYLQIGRISIGASEQLPKIAPTYDVEYTSNANVSLSQSMQVYGGPVVIYKTVNMRFPIIEQKKELLDFFKTVDVYNPFYVYFNDRCPMDEDALYCRLSNPTLPFNYNEANIFTGQLSFQEVF